MKISSLSLLAFGAAVRSQLTDMVSDVSMTATSSSKGSSFITTKDNTQVFYKDWGNPLGPVVVFSHGWPLNSDSWENQMFFLANQGFRVVAHDRRGHGRSGQPWFGNDMNTYADDLNELMTTLNLKNAMLVGHSTGGGEVVRYCARHSTKRVFKVVLVGSVTPVMVQKPSNPDGTPKSVFDSFRASMLANRAEFFLQIPSGPFFGFNRPGANVSQGLIQSWYRQGMLCGFKSAYDCIAAFSETDFTEDLKKLKVPVLILHGDDDQVVPFDDSAAKAILLLKYAVLKVYQGGSHALPNMNIDQVNKDLLAFARS